MRWLGIFLLLILLGSFVFGGNIINLGELEDTPEYEQDTVMKYGKIRTNVGFEIGVFFMFVFAVFAFWWVYHRILEKWLARKIE